MARVKLTLGLLILLLVLAPAVGAPAAVGAQEPSERERQTVYTGRVFDGQGYRGLFYPQNAATIYLLADSQNVLVPRVTEVYWWPLTQEYRADWERRDEALTGTLEIGERTFPMTVYSLQYDGSYEAARTRLLVGDAAREAYAAYRQARADYQAALNRYYEEQERFNAALEDWGREIDRRREEGLPTDDVPVPRQPQPPEQITVITTEPEPGIAVNLPVGEYELRLRGPDGEIVPGSERTVVAFSPRRESLAYNIIAPSRWTRPDTSTDPNDVIFVSGERALYVQPSPQREYDAFYAAKLLEPQQTSVPDRRGLWAWLPTGAAVGTTLQVRDGGGTAVSVAQDTYYARQQPGASLGYDIVPYDASVGEGVSTFDAFKVEPASGSLTVAVPGMPGSTREIRVVNTGMGTPLLALALAPLAGGLIWIASRRWRTR